MRTAPPDTAASTIGLLQQPRLPVPAPAPDGGRRLRPLGRRGGCARAQTFWKRLLDERLASPDTLIRNRWDPTGTFNAGSAALAVSGPWELSRLSAEAGSDDRAALLPVPEIGAERASALGEGVNVVLANTAAPEAAYAFVEFLYERMPRVWNEFGYLPAAEVEVTDPENEAIYRVFEESMRYARNRGPHPEWSQISQAIQSTLTGQASAEDALATAQGTIDAVLR